MATDSDRDPLADVPDFECPTPESVGQRRDEFTDPPSRPRVPTTAAPRTEYAVSCGGDVSEHHFGGRSVTEDYNAAFDLLHAAAQRCKKGHHQVVSRTVEVGPWT